MKQFDTFGDGGFDRSQDRAFIGEHGDEFIHEVGVKCTCRAEDLVAAFADERKSIDQPNCPRCIGEEWLFRDPAVVRCLVSSIGYRTSPIESGWAVPGDMRLVPQAIIIPGKTLERRIVSPGDKLTATWSTPLDGQVIQRGAAMLAGAAGLALGLQDENEDRLLYEPDEALWCEDQEGELYAQGADFTLGPGRVIRWSPSGRSPRRGLRYALKYSAFLEWFVFTPPDERRDGGQDLGSVYGLRRRHVALPNQSPFVVPTDRISLQGFRG